ncbi:unnamed protein product [Rhizoctonia solani]|uniref:Phytase A n=1 Tax=Rhizoctonia solani TaxID=456999 RepID=A0A8H3BDF9_9AGAM|nr:unnamed protein product [Rhizoctonia solani]CAE6525049.1 unnamed protein product [Rhizoctonia solani]
MDERMLKEYLRPSKCKVLVVAFLTAASIFYFQTQYWPLKSHSLQVELEIPQSKLPTLPAYNLSPDVAYNLGPYSPRYAVSSNISSDLPHGCNVTMISILQRHGARYPTKGAGVKIESTLAKLKLVAARDITAPFLQFVPTFNFTYLHDQLVPFGRAQSYVSGQIIAKKYPALGGRSFVRAANKTRIFESSQWWKQGFEGKPYDADVFNLAQPDLAIRIGPFQNNTLGVKTCPPQAKEPTPGSIAKKRWLSIFAPPITKRLNELLPGANLVDKDTVNLMSLCGFDTAAKDGVPSPWCNVFKNDEWKSYEYYTDIEKFYSSSYGSLYAPSEGAGWVNELLARLTNTPVRDNTTTNSTLDGNLKTFPIGPAAPRVFADFSSDNNIMKIIAAMGILRDPTNLPQEGPIPSSQQMVISKVVPFAGSTVVEKIRCSAKGRDLAPGDYVRILVNDAVTPLPLCDTLGYTSGMCFLDNFIKSQAFARSGGNFSLCFEQ